MKIQNIVYVISLFFLVACGQETSLINNMSTSIIGGLIGGLLGVIGTLGASFYGPKKLIEWKEKHEEEKINGPRKRILKNLLSDNAFQDGRKLSTLTLYTGTSADECRRLLVEIGARGIKLKGDEEGWILISKKPFTEE